MGELTAGSDEKKNVIRNNPDKSEFSNLLHCVLCTFRSGENHTFRRRSELAGALAFIVTFIVKCIANQKKINSIAVVVYLLL